MTPSWWWRTSSAISRPGLRPRDATLKAMREVTGPIIAIALVLCAVFVPIAFITGLTGEFYRQFALTIAFSTIISAFNSLTLSPALAALLLKGHDAPKDALTRGMDKVFGGVLRPLQPRLPCAARENYGTGVGGILTRKSRARWSSMACCWRPPCVGFRAVPPGFVPLQDKQYLVSFAQLPARRHAGPHRSGDPPDVGHRARRTRASTAPWPSPACRSTASSTVPSAGIVFVTLKPFDQRRSRRSVRHARSPQRLQAKFAGIKDAIIAIFPPPPVQGLGTIGGFKLQVEDRTDLGDAALNQVMTQVQMKAAQDARAGRRLLQLQDQRAAAVRRSGPHQGAAAGRRRAGCLRHDADLSRLALCQRLQPLRPHL